jgi:CubicO group peptidase (beta-lactamase class C family)
MDWTELERQVAEGRVPGYVAAVRIRGTTHIHASGRLAVGCDAAPMADDTLFRIASVSKPIGAALTLVLVERGVFSLDDEIRRWLPELAAPRVLRATDGPIDDTVVAGAPITVRHLLTFTAGWGVDVEASSQYDALAERGIASGSLPPRVSSDEFIDRIAGVPLAFQPGHGWLYDTPMKVLGVLLARATGSSLDHLLAEHVTGPLDMTDTGFWTPHSHRLAAMYRPTEDGGLQVIDGPGVQMSEPPPLEDLTCGLVSTAPDLLRFFTALADGGHPVLTPESLRLMTADHLTASQRRDAAAILGPGCSWGLGTSVDVEAVAPWMVPGRWGWIGGSGTTAHAGPDGRVEIYLSQRELAGPEDGFDAFWSAVAAA